MNDDNVKSSLVAGMSFRVARSHSVVGRRRDDSDIVLQEAEPRPQWGGDAMFLLQSSYGCVAQLLSSQDAPFDDDEWWRSRRANGSLLDAADRRRRPPLVAEKHQLLVAARLFRDVSTVRRRRRLAMELQASCSATRRRRTSRLTSTDDGAFSTAPCDSQTPMMDDPVCRAGADNAQSPYRPSRDAKPDVQWRSTRLNDVYDGVLDAALGPADVDDWTSLPVAPAPTTRRVPVGRRLTPNPTSSDGVPSASRPTYESDVAASSSIGTTSDQCRRAVAEQHLIRQTHRVAEPVAAPATILLRRQC
eukprot:CAMPEP_0185720314 /NCGR_PEP_ID=MMETSP1164-20130828/50052_1 /TAXON_ID=1104430 /ORGANISM="Chrysoreinhardia sp, Strain CCMP2950" /LENGTH=303 /DNA_ID=CAMNT_0028387977 /DNA_START=2625 /DNA_END=3539 /DNA_ORIENTATION=-